MKTTIYEKIKNRRIELGYSQDELARLMGYKSRSTINKIESGQVDIARTKIAKFAEVLKVPPSYLMGWDDDEGYYTDPEVAEYANKLKNNPDMRLLFDAAEDMTKDDIDYVVDLINRLKGNE